MISTTCQPARLKTVAAGFGLVFFLLILRLGYWQLARGAELRVDAQEQYQRTINLVGKRGSIYTADGHLLVGNKVRYQLTAHPHQLTVPIKEVTEQLINILQPSVDASSSIRANKETLRTTLVTQLSKPSKWVLLLTDLNEEEQAAIKALKITGIDFKKYYQRVYPEASMAAHITGFVGKNSEGNEVGYFGIEGALDKELRGREQQRVINADALGSGLNGGLNTVQSTDGRDVILTIRRDIQRLAEEQLQAGIEKYGAKAGEIVIMEPATGKVLALAAWPSYAPANFQAFDTQSYKNPTLSSLYEPGSTFKTLTVAAGIDAGVITPDTTCPRCTGPVVFDKYSLKTWNNEYNPDITMTEALAKSDNTAMIYIAQLLGKEKLRTYLQAFGMGEKTRVELQEDSTTPFPKQWGLVELATRSFGQGITASSFQMTKAIAAIANQGQLMKPMIVEKVIDPSTGEVMAIEPQVERQVITPQTAQTVTKMMTYAADHGEAQWTRSADHWVAGKTGTSQIAEAGSYLEDKTVTSFVGFGPPEKPQFIMFIKLVEPTSSPWAAETAAPLWYKIAEKLYLLLNIQPDKSLPQS